MVIDFHKKREKDILAYLSTVRVLVKKDRSQTYTLVISLSLNIMSWWN